jgi:ABC-type transport system involved in Fe-S cluster assembly fused permease/ATPase subunit
MKYFNAERHEEHQYYKSSRDFADAEVKTQCVFSLTSLGQYVIANTGILIIVFLAGHQVVSGRIQLADFVMIYEYLKNLYQPLEQLGKLYLDLKQQILDAEGMFFLLNEPVDIEDKPGASKFQIAPDEQAEIQFKNVSFTYQKDKYAPKVQLINDLSFTIKPGERVAIVGPSGKPRRPFAILSVIDFV